jgi:nucleoside-diphosphate-sugar epimerase
MTTKIYLVTGGTGFIGSALVKRLVEMGRRVRVVDNDLRGSRARLASVLGSIELVEADVRDGQAMIGAAAGTDVIIHLAAVNGTENFYKRPELVLEVGVRGMFSMLEAAKANGIEEFFLASSSEAYQMPPLVPTPEDVPLVVPDPWNPRYSYGGSKLISEVMLAAFADRPLRRAVVFRPHNVYGPDMGWEHVLPQLIVRARDRIRQVPAGPVPFEIQGDGSQTRAFVHISDFVDGLVLIIDKGVHRTCYHIGNAEEVTIARVVQEVFGYFGREAKLVPTPLPLGSVPRRCPDVGRLESLGYRPKISLREGVASIADWYVATDEQRSGTLREAAG